MQVPDAEDNDRSSTAQSALEFTALCSLVAATGAALSNQAPTGTTWWDPLLTAAFAALFVGAASRANTTILVAVAGVAAALVGVSAWLIVGLVGFGVAIAAELRPDRRTEMRALAGALVVTTLLHLRSLGPFGLSALIATICAVVVFVSWYRRAGDQQRRVTRRSIGVVVVAAFFAIAVALVVGLPARGPAFDGVNAARAGLSSARAGDPQVLTEQLELAADRLTDAHERIDSPLLKPLYLLPVASQHLRALAVASDQGASVATEAAATVIEANVGDLQLRQGAFDLEVLTTMAPRLGSVADQLNNSIEAISVARSGWLVPALDDRVALFLDEASTVLPEAEIAAEAARVVPAMLGAQGERRYLMLFGSPGETREFGGFVAGYALLGVNDGRFTLIAAGGVNDLLLEERVPLADPESFPAEFVNADPVAFPQNFTNSPNLSVVTRAVTEILPDFAGAPIDGVIYADPYALGALADLTGPVTVEGLDAPLDRDGVIDFIFDGQYRLFPDRFDRAERFEAIGDIAVAMAAAFEQADLPGPERLGELLGPVARAGRLQVMTTDDRENAFLTSVLLQRNFVAPLGIDAVALVQSNSTMSKLDLYLHRDIAYDVQVDASGGLVATVGVELSSQVPSDAPELAFGFTDGTNRVLLSLYSTHELESVTVDGEPHEFVVHEEFGFFRYSLFNIPIMPQQVVDVQIDLRGSYPQNEPYRLGVWAQPLVNPDSFAVSYRHGSETPISGQRLLFENWVFDPANPLD